MDEEVKEKYIEAGRIAKKAREEARSMAEPGVGLEKVAEEAEGVIREEGARPAFPVNLSLNEEAAHYTPKKNDDRELSEGDVLKIDVGAHVDGYIGDTATTLDLGENYKLLEASKEALESALKVAGSGVDFSRVGKAIQEEIKERGFKPIKNLSGHGLGKYTQHNGESIPNVETSPGKKFESGNAYAIEPFATNGRGKVKEGKDGNIYRYKGGNARNRYARKVLKEVEEDYGSLPFASRWLSLSEGRLRMALSNLRQSDVLKSYGILKEVSNGLVSQHEHTIVVLEDETIVTTR